jgi:ribosomal protein S18 acetylase RimI-like enzyme
VPEKTFNEFSLRAATPGDEPFLFDLYQASRAPELKAVGWTEEQISDFCQMQYRILTTQHAKTYAGAIDEIVQRGDRRIGRLKVLESDERLLLVDIALMPEFRGRGIGTKLLEQLTNRACTTRKPVVLHALITSPARRLYERMGFQTVASENGYVEMIFRPEENH